MAAGDGTATDSQEISVLIADDEALMRSGLRLMIDGLAGIAVVAEAGDGIEALAAARRLRPTVVLMDIRMPRMDGIVATAAIRAAGLECAVVVLTAFDTDDFVLHALEAGAVSFLLKDADPDLVISAIRSAASGEARFSPRALTRLVTLAGRGRHRVVVAPPALTEREWQVGDAVAQGLTNAEIAASLFLSVATVKTHLARLFEKFEVTNRVQLALRVLAHPPGDRRREQV